MSNFQKCFVSEIPHEQFSKIPCGSTFGPKSPMNDFSKNALRKIVPKPTLVLNTVDVYCLNSCDQNIRRLTNFQKQTDTNRLSSGEKHTEAIKKSLDKLL